MKNIGYNIRQLRHKLNVNQQEISKRLKISIPAYSKIETGFTDINITRLYQIADLFQVPITEILRDGQNQAAENQSLELAQLKDQLRAKEEEILKLSKKLIDLYEELRERNN